MAAARTAERAGGKRRPGRWLRFALHAAVLVGLVYAGMKYVNGESLTLALQRFDWRFAPLILLLSVAYVLIKGWRFVGQVRELAAARRRTVLCAYVAGQACTLLPGGVTARAGMLEQVGVPASDSAASIALSSLTDQVVLILVSLVSALWFEAARKPAMIILTVLLVLSVVLGIEATRTWLLGVVERLMGKINLLGFWQEFQRSMQEVCTARLLLGGVANAAFAFSLMVLALHLAVRGVGADVPFSTLLLAFTLPALMGRISAMPGGVGVTEAGMIGVLDSAPGVTLDQAAAAALVFRVGTVFFAALVGGLVYFFLWRSMREARH